MKYHDVVEIVLSRAIGLARSVGDSRLVGTLLTERGTAMFELALTAPPKARRPLLLAARGAYDQALQLGASANDYDQTSRLAGADQRSRGVVQLQLGRVLAALGDVERSRAAFESAITAFRQIGAVDDVAEACVRYMRCLIDFGLHDDARLWASDPAVVERRSGEAFELLAGLP